jgi:tetratricopeptide (TPR) repeat protein
LTVEVENQQGTIDLVLGTREDIQRRAERAIENKNYKEAESCYKAILQHNPGDCETHIYLAHLHRYGIRQINDAIAEYKKAIECLRYISNKKAIGLCQEMLGQIYLNDLNMPQEAVEEFKKSQENDPDNTTNIKLLFNLGVALKQLGRADEAAPYFNKIVEMNPESDLAYVVRAQALASQGQLTEALDALQKAKELAKSEETLTMINAAIESLKGHLTVSDVRN